MLEPRRVLNASFELVGVADLFLSDFDNANLDISEADGETAYRFKLDSGTWSGTDGELVSGGGTNTLSVLLSELNSLSIDGDGFGEDLSVEVMDLEFNGSSIEIDAQEIDFFGELNLNGAKGDFFASDDLTLGDESIIISGGGDLKFEAGDTLLSSGSIDVSSNDGVGGTVHLLGDRVGLIGDATVDASGAKGGGEVLIGGDYQGANAAISNASQSYIGSDASIDASAINNGDGGRVIVWADETTQFHGNIHATGGEDNGDGGFVETSGKDFLDVTGAVDASASTGDAGEWLLDPRNVTIVDAGSATLTGGIFTASTDNSTIDAQTIETALEGGTSVTISTGNTGTQDGNIIVDEAILVDASAPAVTLTLNAANNIEVNQAIISTSGTLSVALHANTLAGGVNDDPAPSVGHVHINAAISTNGGSFSTTGVDFSNTVAGTITTGAGIVLIDQTGDVTVDGTIRAINGTVTLDAHGAAADVVVNAEITTIGGAINLRADNDVTFSAAGGVTSTTGNVEITADADNGGAASGAVTLADGTVVNSGSGTIDVNSDGDVTLGSLVTASTSTTAVTITSNEGALVDGGDTDVDIVANGGTGVVDVVTGADGIETTIGTLDLDNATSGNVVINETDAISVANIDQDGTGVVTLSAGGTITVTGDGNANNGVGITASTGTVTLVATGTAGSNVVLRDEIVTMGGNVQIDAGNDVAATSDGDITTTGNVSGTVQIRSALFANAANLGSIIIQGTIDTRGNTVATAGTSGADVTLDATANSGGFVNAQTILTSGGAGTSGSNGGQAGVVDVDADGAVTLATVAAKGGRGDGNGGAGQTVNVNAGGVVGLTSVDTSGGAATNNVGGNAGTVTVVSIGGAINVTNISANGGNTINTDGGSDAAGSAATISLSNTGVAADITLRGLLSAVGGTAPDAAQNGTDTTVLVTSGGGIVNTSAAGTDIAANAVNLAADSGIGAVHALETNAATVSFTNTSNDVRIRESDSAEFSGTSAGTGTVDLVTTLGDLSVGTADIVTNSGVVNLLAEATNASLNLASGSQISTTGSSTDGASVTLSADNVNLGDSVDAGTAQVTITQTTNLASIQLGSTGGPTNGILELSDVELDKITSATINIGDTSTGGVIVNGVIDRTAATNLSVTTAVNTSINFTAGSIDANGGNVSLTTTGTGGITSGSEIVDITAASLTLNTGSAGAGASGNPLRFNATTLNATTTGDGSLFLYEADTVTIDATGLDAEGGTVELAGGTFVLGGSDRISNTSNLTIDGRATLDLAANDASIRQLQLIDGSIVGTGTLTGSDTLLVNKGTIGANLAGAVGLSKSSAETVTLSGVNTYSIDTAISQGTLLVNGSTASASTVRVSSGATFGGTGTVSGDVLVQNGGTITGGTVGTVGTLTVGSLSLDDSTYYADIDGDTSDTIVSAGTIDLKASMQGILAVNAAGTTTAGTSFKLVDNTAAGTALVNPELSDGAGTIAEGAAATVNGQAALYSYIGGAGGNDLTLTTTGTMIFTGTGADDDITLQKVDIGGIDYLQVLIGTTIAEQRLLSSVTDVTINGGDGSDTLTLNYSTGTMPGVDVTFHGDAPTSGTGDSLIVNGGSFDSATYDMTGTGAGNVVFAGGSGNQTISFTGLEPVTITSSLTDVTINVDSAHVGTGINTVELLDSGTAGMTTVTASATGATFESITFSNPTNELLINGEDGGGADVADNITVTGLGSGFSGTLSIDGQGGADLIDLNIVTVSSLTTLNLTADTITQSEAVTVTGTTTLNDQTSGNAINLIKAGNDFGTVETTATGDVTLLDASGIILGASTIGGNLDVTSTTGDITDSATVTVSGTGSFTTSQSNADIDLNELSVRGSLDLNTIGAGGNATVVNAIAIDVNTISVSGVLDATATTGDITQSQALTVNTAIFTATGNSITLDNAANDFGGSVTITTAGNVTLVDANDIDIDGATVTGALDLNAKGGNITDTAALDVDGTTTLRATDNITLDNAANDFATIGSVTGDEVSLRDVNGFVLGNASTTTSLTLEVDAGTTVTQAAGAAITGSGQLLKNGDGTLILSQTNNFSGTTTVSSGMLRVTSLGSTTSDTTLTNGILAVDGEIDGNVIVNDGALQGTDGTITGTVTVNTGTTMAPGGNPGVLSTGDLILNGGSTFTVETDDDNSDDPLSLPLQGGVAGTDYDQVRVIGTVVIDTNVTLDLQDIGSTQNNPRDVYTIINNDGTADTVSGTFDGLANGTIVTAVSGIDYRIYYNGGDGNDVVLIGHPATLPDVYISNSFTQAPGTLIADVDFTTPLDQPGVYGVDAFLTIAEGIEGVDTGGTIHVNSGTFAHNDTLNVDKSVTIDGQGLDQTEIRSADAPSGRFDQAIHISADNVTISDAQLGWVDFISNDYRGYVIVTTGENTTISRVQFGETFGGDPALDEGYRSAIVFEQEADGLEVSDSIFEGRWGRAAIRDGEDGSGENFLITRNEFREDHFRWGPIAIGPQGDASTPNNFAFSGEISFNYFGNGLDPIDFQSGGDQNYTVTITNQGLSADGLDIVHNTFDWNDTNVQNQNGVFAQPVAIFITPSFTANTDQILIQDNIFNGYAYGGVQPGSEEPGWQPSGGVMEGALDLEGALDFDGVDDFGVFQSPLINIGSAGTIAFWINPEDVSSQRHALFNGGGVEVTLRNGAIYFYPDSSEGSSLTYSALGSFAANSWTHVAVSWDFDAQSTAIYINGVEASYLSTYTPDNSSWSTPADTANQLIRVGSDANNSDRAYPGRMDDIGIFNEALTAAEVLSIRNNGVSTYTGSKLIAHWDVDQASGNVAVDNQNGIELTLSTDGIVPFGPKYRAGQGHFDGALEFDGADDLATFQDPTFDVGEKGTLNFWVNFDDTGSSNQFFEGPGNAGFEFQYRTNGGGQVYGRTTTDGEDFVIRSGGDAATLDSGDGWHNIQYTWDFAATEKLNIYLDGVESTYISSTNLDRSYTPSDLRWASVVDTVNGIMHMGYDPGSRGQFFDGMMDDVAWYNDVLTQSELDAVRIDGVSSHADLLAHWAFDSAPSVDNTYAGDSGTSIELFLQQLPPEPPVTGYSVVAPSDAGVLNNVFFNDVAGTYVDSNLTLDPGNITGPTANPFFNGDQAGHSSTTLEEFGTLRFGSSAAYQSTEFQADIATAIPHVGANQLAPVAVGIEDVLIVGSGEDDQLVITFDTESTGSFVLTTDVGGTNSTLGPISFSGVNSFTFDSFGGDDVLEIIQPSSEFLNVSGGIFFNAGTELADGIGNDAIPGIEGDTLILSPAAGIAAVADTIEHIFQDETTYGHVGSVIVTDPSINAGAGGSTTIFYNGLEPRIFDNLDVDNRIFTFNSTAAIETIALQSSGDSLNADAYDNQIGSSIGAIALSESVSFNNPNVSLTINGGDGNQTIDINSLHADYRAAMTVLGNDGTDVVNFNTSLTLGVADVVGTLSANAETIKINPGVSINTTGGTTDGDVALTAITDITMHNSATLVAGSADVALMADGNVNISRITSADAVKITSHNAGIVDNRSADELANITANSAVLGAATGIGTADDLDTDVAALTAVNSMTGNIDIDESDAITLTEIETHDGTINVDAAGAITVTDVEAGGSGNIILTTTVGSTASIELAGTANAAGNTITLNSDASIIGDSVDSNADLIAETLSLTAKTGIGVGQAIETTAASLSFANNAGAVQVTNSETLSVTSGSTNGDIELCVTAGNLVLSGNLAAGSNTIRLQSDTGNINQTSGNVTATELGARASTGITLASIGNNVTTFAATTTTGDITFNEADGFTVSTVTAGSCIMGVAGVTTPGSGNIKLNAELGTLEITENVTSVGGDIEIDAEVSVITGLPAAGALDITTSATGGITIGAGRNVQSNGITGQVVNIQAESGTISLTGAGTVAAAVEDTDGVALNFTNVMTTSGNIVIQGTGGNFVRVDGEANNDGIEVNDSSITSSADGNITLTGNGGAGDDSEGVEFEESNVSSSGIILITGMGGASGDFNAGVDLDNSTTISGLNSGSVTIDGTGGAMGNANDGVQIQDGSVLTAVDGKITIIGTTGTGDAIVLLNTSDITGTGDATITLDGTGSIFMEDHTSVTAANAQLIDIIATKDITLSEISTVGGEVQIESMSGAIIDGGDSGVDITASNVALRAVTGIGSADDLNTTARVLAAETESGNILVSNDRTSGLDIGTFDGLSGITITDALNNNDGDSIGVRSTGVLNVYASVTNNDEGHITLNSFGNLTAGETIQTGGTGTILLKSQAGINVTDIDNSSDGVVTTNGDLLLQSIGSVSLADNLTSTTGDIGVQAEGSVTLLGEATTGAGVLTAGDVIVSGDTISMRESSEIRNTGAGVNNISLQSTVGNVTLESVDAGIGFVRIDAAEDILDRNGGESTNVIADGLQMTAAGVIGGTDLTNADVDENSFALNTDVNALSASAGTGIYVREADELIVNTAVTTSTISVSTEFANTDGSKTTTSIENTQPPISGLTTTDGPIKVVTSLGNLTVESAIEAKAANAVLLETRETAGSDVILRNQVTTHGGNVTIVSTDDIEQSATGNISTGGGDLYLRALNTDGVGSGIDMTTGTSLNTGGGDVRIEALGIDINDESNISLQTIDAGSGSIDLIATGSILDAQLGGTNLIADSLRMVADYDNDGLGSIGSAGGTISPANVMAINTNVATIAAKSATGIYIEQSGQSILIDDVSVSFTRAHFSSHDSIRTETLQDLTTTNNGPIKLVNLGGDITIHDGSDADDAGVVAHHLGDVLLETRAVASGSIDIQADVQSSTGHVTLWSATDVMIGDATVSTGGTGTLIVETVAGSITMATEGTFETADGDIHVRANRNVTVGRINSSADVALIATTGFIHDVDADDASVDISASGLFMNSAIEVGQLGGSANAIETAVTTLTARAGSGGVNIIETDALIVDEVEVNTSRAKFDSGVTSIVDALQSDVSTTENGSIVLRTRAGDITLNDGTALADRGDDNTAVSANGAGNVLITAEGDGTSIQANEDIASSTGNITLSGNTNVVIEDDITTGGSGTVFVQAGNGSITLNDGADGDTSGITTASGDILLDAETDVSLSADIKSTRGDVGIDAGNDILQNENITTTTGNVLMNAARNIVTDGAKSITATVGNILLSTGHAIRLGLVDGTDVGLDAGTDITDNNAGGATNIRATNLRATAGGTIGTAGGTTSSTNLTAIDIDVTNVAAESATGIYLQSTNATMLNIDHIDAITANVDINQVQSDANILGIDIDETHAELDDLTTTDNGPIKVVAASITANDGLDEDQNTVSSVGTGDILLDALAGAVVLNAEVVGDTGHITVHAATSLTVEDAIRTNGTGTVHLNAQSITINDAASDADTTGIATMDGDVLIKSMAGDLSLNADISGHGDIGLSASATVSQNANIDTSSGSVLMTGGTLTMASGTSTTAASNILAQATRGDLTLGLLDATDISLDATAAQIVDGNGGGVTNVRAANVRMSAATGIGDAPGVGSAGTNAQAIDLEASTIATRAGGGTYLQQITAGGDLFVDHVASMTVTVEVQRAAFDSSTVTESATETLLGLEDLTTTGGNPIKVVAQSGSITIDGGSDGTGIAAGADGDVLLEARGATSDVIINVTVDSGSGHITFDAGHDVDINAEITTGKAGTIVVLAGNDIDSDATVTTADGDILLNAAAVISQTASITTTNGDVGLIAATTIDQTATGKITTNAGDVLVSAGGNWTMAGTARITVGGGQILGQAEGTLTLGQISLTNTTNNNVALRAGASILDANAAAWNIQETTSAATTTLSLRAGSGSIGAADPASAAAVNSHAIDLNVDTVAASSATGIYLRELAAGGAITVDTAAAVNVDIEGVRRANFNSSISDVSEARTLAALEDLTTTGLDGDIKLVAESGTITVNPGTTATAGISANGTGDILLESRGTNRDVIVNASITAVSGHLTLDAERNVDVNAALRVSSGNGTIYVLSGTDTDIDATLTTANGDILIEAGDDLRQTQLISSNNGDIGLIAAANVTQANAGDITTGNGDVLVSAGRNWTMAGTARITVGGGQILGQAEGTLTLGQISLTNTTNNNVALRAGASILDANAAAWNIQETTSAATTTLSLRAGSGSIGAADPASAAAVNSHAIDLNVDTVAASSATGIYLRELAAGGAITVDTAAAVNVDIEGVRRANFNSSISDVSEARTLAALEDLTTTGLDGDIKLVAEDGTITIQGGADAVGISASNTGDLLLEARGTDSDLIINAEMESGAGYITLSAADDILQNADLSTSGAGTIFFSVANATPNGAGSDGVIMAADATTNTGGGNVFVQATNGSGILLGSIDVGAGTIRLAAEGDILDNNGAGVNITAESLIAIADSNRDGVGQIGNVTSGNSVTAVDARSIDTDIAFLSASSATGIFTREADSLTISQVAFTGVAQVNFNSTNTEMIDPLTSAGLLTTHDGDILVDAQGSLAINEAISADTADVRLIADGNMTQDSDGLITANELGVRQESHTGNIVLSYSNHVDELAAFNADNGGSISVRSTRALTIGSVAAQTNRDTAFAKTTGVTATNGDVLLESEGRLTLNNQIHAGSADVRFIADGNMTQAATGFITANELGVRQESTTGNVELGFNNRVDEFAALNADPDGNILFRSTRDLTISELTTRSSGDTAFSSTNGLSATTLNLYSGGILTNAADVAINITDEANLDTGNNAITLGNQPGDIVNFGSLNVTGSVVTITEDSDTRLTGIQATSLNLTSDGTITDVDTAPVSIVVGGNATLMATDITLADQADDVLRLLGDVRIDATMGDVNVAEPGFVELGTVEQMTGKNVSLNENTAMLLHTLVADENLTLFSETSIRNLVAANAATRSGLIAQTASLTSDGFIHLAGTHFDQISGRTGANATISTDPRLTLNTVADNTGVKVLDALNQNIDASVAVSPNFISGETLDQVTSDFSFVDHQGGRYGLYLTNQVALDVGEFVGDGSTVNLYVETSDGQDLTISNRIAIQNRASIDGSVTLVAGRDLILNGQLETIDPSSNPGDTQRILQIQTIVDAFNAGEGPAGFESTESVILETSAFGDTKDLAVGSGAQNVLQRVSTQLGIAGEAGFLTIVRYADGLSQSFDTFAEADASIQGGTGVKGPTAVFNGAIPAHAVGSPDAVVFERAIPFSSIFLNTFAELPTTLVARRSTDFFLFEDGGRTDLNTDSIDLNSNTDNVDGVLSNALPPTISMPSEITIADTTILQTNSIVDLGLNTTTLLSTTDEIPVQFERTKEVTIFSVGFDDENGNGQPEDAEVPLRRMILETEPLAKSSNADDPLQENTSLSPGQRALSSGDLRGNETPSPTAVEAWIEEYRNDPLRPAGVYVVIESDPQSGENILRVFTVRDFESFETTDPSASESNTNPDSAASTNPSEPTLPLPIKQESTNDESSTEESDEGSVVEESGVGVAVLASLNLRRKRKRRELLRESPSDTAGETKTSPEFGRRQRRWRRLHAGQQSIPRPLGEKLR